jgi:hypothetical protein
MAEDGKKRIKVALFDGKRMMGLGEFKPFPPETRLVAYVDLLGFKDMILKDPTGKNIGSSRINVILPLFENQQFVYLRLSMVITTWIYSNLTEMSVVVPPNP